MICLKLLLYFWLYICNFLFLPMQNRIEVKSREFDKIYERNYRRSFLFAKSYVHDDLVAEDIAAESLFKFWQICRDKKEEVSEAMLVTILKNKSIDYLRSSIHKQVSLDEMNELVVKNLEIQISSLESCEPYELFSKEINTIVIKTLNTLPELTREIFLLSRSKNLSVKEIAERKYLTPKAVEYHITKSLKVLRIALKDYLPIYLMCL